MHFVKKVPTSDEEKALKEKQRAAKLKLFCGARDRIFAKRAAGELDDEMLALTQKLLEKNPDIYTFWNVRREAIQKRLNAWHQCMEEKGAESECYAECEKKIDDQLSGELHLSQTCIEANPKSYSAWYHRGWALRGQTHPDLFRDLKLCEKALQMDCRNFHCWDHRRVVATMAQLTPEQELKFSNRLIAANFSNYSAWHYRSVLLPQLHSNQDGTLQDAVVASELKKVTSAFFTDPDDQSAWVYTRWLLAQGSPTRFLDVDSSVAPFPLSASVREGRACVVLSRPADVETLLTHIDGQGEWKAVSPLCVAPRVSRVWICDGLDELTLRIGDEQKVTVSRGGVWADAGSLHKAFRLEQRPSNAAIDEITKNCKELIDCEPDNPWALYMYTLCAWETREGCAHPTLIIDNLNMLAHKLDSKRGEVYARLAARRKLEVAVASTDDEGRTLLDRLISGAETRLPLRYMDLQCVEGVDLLACVVEDVDLTGNPLSSADDLARLPLLTHLTLNETRIQGLSASLASYLPLLSFVSLSGCPGLSPASVLPFLQSLPRLGRVLYCEGPLAERDVEMKEALKEKGVRCFPHYL